jgi:hypothetical protein
MTQSTENTMTPRNYIIKAFDRVLDEIGQVKIPNQAHSEELKVAIGEQNSKIDIILRAITGMGNS